MNLTSLTKALNTLNKIEGISASVNIFMRNGDVVPENFELINEQDECNVFDCNDVPIRIFKYITKEEALQRKKERISKELEALNKLSE
jgi:transcriptional regulator